MRPTEWGTIEVAILRAVRPTEWATIEVANFYSGESYRETYHFKSGSIKPSIFF